MAFITSSDCLRFWPDLMCNGNFIIDLGMTLNTPDIGKMGSLVWKPLMFFQNVDLLPVGKQLETVKIRMATQTDGVIIGYGLLNIAV